MDEKVDNYFTQLLVKMKEKHEHDELTKHLRNRENKLSKNYNTITTHKSRIKPLLNLPIKTFKSHNNRLNTFLPDLPQLPSIQSLMVNLSTKCT